jgi:hypothetical protein
MIQKFLRNRFGQDQRAGGKERGQGGGFGQGQRGGRGSGNKPSSGPGGNCICPKCGKIVPHVAGQRCIDQICPECGTKMIRE